MGVAWMPKLTKFLTTAAICAVMAGEGTWADTVATAAGNAAGNAADDSARAAALARSRRNLTAETVVATVNGQDITLGQMITVRDSLPAQYRSLPDDKLFDGILQQLIQQTALAQVGEKRMTHADEIALEVQRRAYLAGSLLNYTADKSVTDGAIRKTYDEKYAHAEPTRQYHAAHILVKTKQEADRIRKEIDGGADFATEAKTYSQDGSKANGGDLGWFKLDAMVKPFGDAVVGMKDGEIAGPVQTRYGWHIIKLMGTRMVDVPKLADVRDQLTGDIRQEAVEKRIRDVVDNAKIDKMTDGIDPSVLKDQKILGN